LGLCAWVFSAALLVPHIPQHPLKMITSPNRMFGSYCQTPSCLSNAKQALCASAGDGVWGLAALFMSFMVRCFGVMRLDTLSVSAPLREKALEACGYVQLFVLCEAGAALTTDPSQCCHYEGSGAHPSALILTPTRSTTKELVTNKLSHI